MAESVLRIDLGKCLVFLDHLERGSFHNTSDRTTAQTGGADTNGLVRAVFRGNTHRAQIRLELPTGDAGDFGTDTAEVLGTTTRLNDVTNLLFLTATTTNACHEDAPSKIWVFCDGSDTMGTKSRSIWYTSPAIFSIL